MSTSAVFLKIEEKRVVSTMQEAALGLNGAQSEAVLDFSCVRRIDSCGLHALEDFARVAEERNVKVVFRGVNVDIYKVFKLVKLTQRFSFVN
jgi:anti-anti-sigma regulatory factor